MPDRRESLKIIGAIGATCAFPVSAAELYGQHGHATTEQKPAEPDKPKALNAREFAIVSQIAERIIPATDTPGAIGAGVPEYIDQVVAANPEHKKRLAPGFVWLKKESSRRFRKK